MILNGAHGMPITEDSDLDLLIVIEESDEKRHKQGKVLYGTGITQGRNPA